MSGEQGVQGSRPSLQIHRTGNLSNSYARTFKSQGRLGGAVLLQNSVCSDVLNPRYCLRLDHVDVLIDFNP
jgi:hypothetical protein